MPDHTYFTSGRVYARLFGAAEAFEWPGLVDSINVAIAETVINLPDRTQSGGGNYKQVRRIDTVGLTINHREFYPSTLARALFGESSDVVGAPVVDEAHTASPGRFIPLDNPGPYTALTVTDDVPTTIDEAGNFEIRGAGLWILETAPDIPADTDILVSYTHPNYTRIQAIRTAAPEVEIFFEGINEAVDDLPAPARFHKVRFGPAAELALMSGDDFGALSVSGEVLKDLSKTGTLSQYFYKDIVTPAA